MYAKKAAAMKDDKKQEQDKLIQNSFTLDAKAEMDRIKIGKGETKNRFVDDAHDKLLVFFVSASRIFLCGSATITYNQLGPDGGDCVLVNRVLIPLPRMHTPFANCDPYKATNADGTPVKKKAKKVVLRQLVVDFRSEDQSADIQGFRLHIGEIEKQTTALLAARDDAEGKDHRRVSPIIKPSEDYDDKITLKFEKGSVVFTDPTGKFLEEEDIEFDEVDVEPTAHFLDFWKYDGVYWPRLRLVECIIHRRL